MALGRDSGGNKKMSSRERKSMLGHPEMQRLEEQLLSAHSALVLIWLLGHLPSGAAGAKTTFGVGKEEVLQGTLCSKYGIITTRGLEIVPTI